MKKITLFAFLFFMTLMGYSQVPIGNGNNESQNLPFEPYYGYSYTQSIYLASEISASGNITALQWYYSGTSALANNQDLTIYLGHSTKTTFASSTDWEPLANLTAVYTGGITVSGPGWVTLTFTTPFAYNGTDNLIIAVDENTAGYDSSTDDFYNSAVTGNRSIAYRNDSTNPDPATPPTATGTYAFVPNVILMGITQPCPTPTNLTVYNVTDTTADMSWTENGSSFDWEYVVQTPGGGVPTASGTAIDQNPFEVGLGYGITGLTPNTNYEVYVRSVCSVSMQSSWMGPIAFKTECSTYTVPTLEEFTTYVPACWVEAAGGDATAGPATFGTSSWGADGFGNNGTTGSAKINIYSTGKNEWIMSPVFNIPATGYELKFDAAATQYSSTSAPTTAWETDDFVEVLVTTSGNTNWTVLFTYNDTNTPANTGSTKVIDLDAYAGQNVKFAFRAVEGATNGSADIDFFIDNFEIRETPSNPPTCATNVVATPHATCGNFATAITWDSVSGADGYKIIMGTTSGGNDILDNVDLGTAITYSYIGNINTTYYFTIIPYNGNGDATGCTEVNFTTNANGCYCTSQPTSNDGAGITNVQLATTDFANGDVTYFDHSGNAIDFTQGQTANVQISFATGYTYDTNIWIDFNDNFTFESSELVQTGIASTSTNPTVLDASFTMPAAATLGTHKMRIGTADSGQATPNPCYSGSYGVTLDFDVNVVDQLNSDAFSLEGFRAYPNPVKDVLHLSYTSPISTVRVMNILGQEVFNNSTSSNEVSVDMSSFNKGAYLVNVEVDGTIHSLKIIKE